MKPQDDGLNLSEGLWFIVCLACWLGWVYATCPLTPTNHP